MSDDRVIDVTLDRRTTAKPLSTAFVSLPHRIPQASWQFPSLDTPISRIYTRAVPALPVIKKERSFGCIKAPKRGATPFLSDKTQKSRSDSSYRFPIIHLIGKEWSMKVAVMCFSPTGTTRRVCLEIAKGISDSDPTVLDLTLPDGRTLLIGDPERIVAKYDHVVVGVPVYGGKIPPLARDTLSLVKGHGRRATAVVVYGNRDFGVALRRLCEILDSNGFQVVSAGAFIGEHSYSAVIPVAVSRPDDADLDTARRFGAQSARASGVLAVDDVEEQLDMFSKSPKTAGLKPRYSATACTECGSCGKVCPSGIIASSNGAYVSEELKTRCIGCMACVRACPNDARTNKVNPMERLVLGMMLKKPSKARSEPKVFMPA